MEEKKEGERAFLPPRGPTYSGAALLNYFSFVFLSRVPRDANDWAENSSLRFVCTWPAFPILSRWSRSYFEAVPISARKTQRDKCHSTRLAATNVKPSWHAY